MKIQILGSGCGKCRKLLANVESAVKKKAIGCEIRDGRGVFLLPDGKKSASASE